MFFVPNVAEAVRMNDPTASVNDKETEEKVKSWIRTAKDRDGGCKRLFEAAALRKSLGVSSLRTSNDFELDQQDPVVD